MVAGKTCKQPFVALTLAAVVCLILAHRGQCAAARFPEDLTGSKATQHRYLLLDRYTSGIELLRRFPNGPSVGSVSSLGAAIQAFIDDVRARSRAAGFEPVFALQLDEWRLFVRERTEHGDRVLVGALEEAEDFNDNKKGALAVYARWVKPDGDFGPPYRLARYFDDGWVDEYHTRAESNTSSWRSQFTGPKSDAVEVVELYERERNGTMRLVAQRDRARRTVFAAAPFGLDLGPQVRGMLGLPEALSPSCRSADLSWQFQAPRDQGSIGSCHAFAATGLIEAALRRAYGISIHLSEADMLALGVLRDKSMAVTGEEGGPILLDLQQALRYGLATEKTVAYQDAERQVRMIKTQAQIARIAARAAISDLFQDSGSAVPVDIGTAAAAVDTGEGVRARLAAASTQAKRERASVQSALAGATIEPLDGDGLPGKIAERLCAGLPVAVSIFPSAMSGEWGNLAGGHGVIIQGFDESASGPIFHVRNSWANAGHELPLTNPDIRPSEYSWITAGFVLRVPADRGDHTVSREALESLSSLAR